MKMESDRPVITDGIVQILLSDPGQVTSLKLFIYKKGNILSYTCLDNMHLAVTVDSTPCSQIRMFIVPMVEEG